MAFSMALWGAMSGNRVMSTTMSNATTTTTKQPKLTASIRVDVQILRAIAVVSVLVYHFWPHRLPGGFVGVDVFFAISGFLITTLILREIRRTHRLRLRDFWVRRIRRIFPAAIVVIVAVVIAVQATRSPYQMALLYRHVFSSAFSTENLLLAADAVDYDRRTDATSPLQHYWSLAVEEQFYLFWPVLIAVLLWFTRHATARFESTIKALLPVLALASFAYAASISSTSPANYFDFWARAWELAAGALVAVFTLDSNILAVRAVSILRYVAWGLLGLTTFIPGLETATPGWGVLPAITATTIILATPPRETELRHTPWYEAARFGAVWLGDRSYSLYLWHFPVVVLLPIALHGTLTWPTKLLAIGALLVLSELSFRFVENPVRNSTHPWTRRPFVVLSTAATLAVATVVVTAQLPTSSFSPAEQTVASHGTFSDVALTATTTDFSPEYPYVVPHCRGAGAAVFHCDPSTQVLIDPNSIPEDPPASTHCVYAATSDSFDMATTTCTLGDLAGARSIAWIGDSHARAMWKAADDLGVHAHASVSIFVHGGCALSRFAGNGCRVQNQLVRDAIYSRDFDLVVLVQRSAEYPTTPDVPVLDDFLTEYRELVANGVPVVVVRDNPLLTTKQRGCIQLNFTDPSSCEVKRAGAFHTHDFAADAAEKVGIPVIDLSDIYCGPETCHTSLGGIMIYRDQHHLSPVFAETLAPFLWSTIRELGFLAPTTP